MKNRELPIAAAAAIFGILVWLSVSLREEYTVTVAAPLSISGIQEGWALRSPLPASVQLRVRGNGWRLALLLLGPELRLDYLYDAPPQQRTAITTRDIEDRISLRPGLLFVGVSPDSILIEVERSVEKMVPVVLDYQLSFREGYGLVEKAVLQPESVTIRGAESVIRPIESWPTQPGSLEDLRSPVDSDVPLARSATHDISLSVGTVHLHLAVDAFAEKVLTGLHVDVISLPPTREVILIPPKVELVVRGGIKRLSTIEPIDFRIGIDYEEILTDTTGVVDMKIIAPDGVQVVRKRPERLQYVVRKRL